MAYTPGPWTVSADYLKIEGADGRAVALTSGWQERREECMLNAYLIACAPELLEALIAMRYAFTSDGTDSQHIACRMADAALEKVTRSST